METMWILVSIVAGASVGFLLFALLQMSRDAGRKRQVLDKNIGFLQLEGDTLTRF